ncbi:hypothetical protein ZWY2020_019511 [Hordeum vulgare]|nr:hypothetical protein ZWY2020_019511 [Hordeum vulgare]
MAAEVVALSPASRLPSLSSRPNALSASSSQPRAPRGARAPRYPVSRTSRSESTRSSSNQPPLLSALELPDLQPNKNRDTREVLPDNAQPAVKFCQVRSFFPVEGRWPDPAERLIRDGEIQHRLLASW